MRVYSPTSSPSAGPQRTWLEPGDIGRLNRQFEIADHHRHAKEWGITLAMVLAVLGIVAIFCWSAWTVVLGFEEWFYALFRLWGLLV